MAKRRQSPGEIKLELQRSLERANGVSELHRTIRTISIAVLVVAAIACICYTVIQVLSVPPWLALALAVLNLAQSVVIWRLKSGVKTYTKDTSTKLAIHQQEEDHARTSSGLSPDGTDPPESQT